MLERKASQGLRAAILVVADIIMVFSLATIRFFLPIDLAPYPNILRNLRASCELYQREMPKDDDGGRSADLSAP